VTWRRRLSPSLPSGIYFGNFTNIYEKFQINLLLLKVWFFRGFVSKNSILIGWKTSIF
jgi:hypothetical protein